MAITITEALAEIKTISKRISKKQQFVYGYLSRQDGLKDPLAKEGGSEEAVKSARQAITDLETRLLTLRKGIAKASEQTVVTINGVSRPITDWLIWRREVAPERQSFLEALRLKVAQTREQAKRQGQAVVTGGAQAEKPTDVIVNINEQELAKEIESLEDTLGQLDGQLSLKNATVAIVE